MGQNLKIGFDAKRAFHNNSGLGNYSRTLIAALQQYYRENDYVLFTPSISNRPLTATEIVRPSRKWLTSLWRSFQIPDLLSAKGIDIYHGLSAELPFNLKKTKTKYVVTIHDLIFLRFPELYSTTDRKIYTYKTRYACDKADKIIAISEQTKRDLVQYLDIPESKISVVYQTCAAIFEHDATAEKKAEVRQRYQLPAQYLLTVGTIERRKNALLILEAMKKAKSSMPLVLVGKPTSYKAELLAFAQQNQLSDRLIFLHDADFADFPAIYQMAICFIYPSRFEGFGIPIIEATKSKIPAIAATGSSLQEAGGPAIISINPDSSHELADAINGVLANDNTAQIAAAFQYSQRFSEQHFAADTMAVYQSL